MKKLFSKPFLNQTEFIPINKALQLPRYVNNALFNKIDTEGKELISFDQLSK